MNQNQNQNQQARMQAAYQLALTELNLRDVPMAEDIAKAIHLDWSDNRTYNDVLQMNTQQIKALIQEAFAGMGMNNNVAQLTEQKLEAVLKAFRLYMRKKENLNQIGGRRSKKSRKTKKSKRTKRTRRH